MYMKISIKGKLTFLNKTASTLNQHQNNIFRNTKEIQLDYWISLFTSLFQLIKINIFISLYYMY